MKSRQDQGQRFAAFSLLALCGAVVAVMCLYASSGIFPINTNDGSNFLLQALYAGQGLTPYRDYGFVYPPGIALFFGDLLHITNGGTFLRIVWLMSFVLLGLNSYLVVKLKDGIQGIIGGGLLAFFSVQPIVILFRSHGTEPFTTLLLITVTLLTLQCLKGETYSRARLLGISLCGFAITMIRWDRALAVGLVESAVAALVFLLAWRGLFQSRNKNEAIQQARRIAISAGVLLCGAGIAFGFMALYALGSNTWSQALWFIFGLAPQTMPYRLLPFVLTNLLDPNTLWLTSLTAILGLGVAGFFVSKNKGTLSARSMSEALFLLAAPMALVPYALGRSDGVHFLPMASMAAVSIIIAATLWDNGQARRILLVVFVILCLPLLGQTLSLYHALYAQKDILLQASVFDKNLEGATSDCVRLVPAGARSLFVGRVSYGHFIDGPMIMYLAHRDLVPATPYIAEDPGIQNSCAYGKMIADDLRRAPRPMVAFLSVSPQWREPNATETMHSCNHIENFLHAAPASMLGTCQIGPDKMLVVEYGGVE